MNGDKKLDLLILDGILYVNTFIVSEAYLFQIRDSVRKIPCFICKKTTMLDDSMGDYEESRKFHYFYDSVIGKAEYICKPCHTGMLIFALREDITWK